MKVALITVPHETEKLKSGENLGIKYLASFLKNMGHHVDIFEMELDKQSPQELEAHLQSGGYGLIGFGVLFTSNLINTIAVAESFRKSVPNAHFTIGGQGISFYWREVLAGSSAFDSAVCFEGERTLLDMVTALEADSFHEVFRHIPGMYVKQDDQIIFTGHREPATNLDSIPFPLRNKHSYHKDTASFFMLTSRGCSAFCTFCASGSFGNRYHKQSRWRARTAQNIIAEIDQLVNIYGAKHISFVDDDFLGACESGPQRALEFVDLLKSRPYNICWGLETRVNEIDAALFQNMKDVGLVSVLCGFDAGNEQDLKIYGKGATLEDSLTAIKILRALKLVIQPGFIMFNPLSDTERIRTNLEFIAKAGFADFSILTNRLQIFAGSPLIKYFSRYSDLKKSVFRYTYHIKDHKVRWYENSLRNTLMPMRAIEKKIQGLIFRLSVHVRRDTAKQPEADYLLSQLSSIQQMAGDFAVDTAKQLLERVEQYKGQQNPALAEDLLLRVKQQSLTLSNYLHAVYPYDKHVFFPVS